MPPTKEHFFPTCQVRSALLLRLRLRFASSSSSFLLPPSSAAPCRARTASSGSECSHTELNSKRKIAVFPAGPEQQAQDQSVPRRTRTTSDKPNSKRKIAVFPAGPEQQLRIRVFPAGPKSKLSIRVFPSGPQLQALDRSVPCRTRTASSGSE